MPNNNNIYNAALGGAASGVSSRWLTSTSPSSYAQQVALIAAFATAFDAAIPADSSGGSRGQCQVVSEICAAFCKDRNLTTAIDMDLAVAPLVALYTQLAPTIAEDIGGGGAALIIGPGLSGSIVTCSFLADDGDILLQSPATTIYVPDMTGDCTYILHNADAPDGATVGFAGPFTGGQLTVMDEAENPLFSMLDPGGRWGVALFDGSVWVRYASGA